MLQKEIVVKIKAHHFIFSNCFFEKLAVYEILRKTFAEADRPQTTTWRMHNACWRPMATKTHLE
jgi:hypothetical protein